MSLFTALTLASWTSKSFTPIVRPFHERRIRAVLPVLSRAWISAPLSIRIFTIRACSGPEATMRAVELFLPFALTSAPDSSRERTFPRSPRAAADCSGPARSKESSKNGERRMKKRPRKRVLRIIFLENIDGPYRLLLRQLSQRVPTV